jgi:hypothetical protein
LSLSLFLSSSLKFTNLADFILIFLESILTFLYYV